MPAVVTALLDTSVLWLSLQRDFLLSLAVKGLYRPIWSQAVLDELIEAEVEKRIKRGAEPDQARVVAQRLADQMNWAFDDSCVHGWEPLVGSYRLPDPDDEHLVAAAVVGGAQVIVSDNIKDLPTDKLPDGLDVVTAAQFAHDTVSVAPAQALAALRQISARYVDPPRTVDNLLSILDARDGMNAATELIRQATI